MLDWRVIESPWGRSGPERSHATVGERPLLLTDLSIKRVQIRDQGLDLPSVGRRRADGRQWSAFELIGTGRVSTGNESIELECGETHERMTVHLEGGLPAIPDSDEDLPDAHNGLRAFGLIGRHTDLIYDPVEKQARLLDGCASIDLADFLDDWKRSDETQDARLALIVRIASKIGGTVQSIGNQPRFVLRRRRAMERVGAVRQVDPAGIRWLVRQPGSNLAERAGARQRVLAVIREDSVDTHENRVIRDLLDRCMVECRVWQRDNYEFSSSSRFTEVSRFASTVRRLRRVGPLSTVRRAMGAVEPNYVLQHDQRYSKVWPWYVKLRRRQQEEDSLWRWSHRTFAEAVRLSLAWALDLIEQEEEFPPGVGFSRQLLLRPEQQYGAFVDPRSDLSAWLARDTSGNLVAMALLSGEQIGRFETVMRCGTRIGDLAPDALIVTHDPFTARSAIRAVAVWSRLRFDRRELASGQLEDLAASLAEVSSEFPIEGLIIEPAAVTETRARVVDERRVPVPGRSPLRVQVVEAPLYLDRARIGFQSVRRSALLP
jgi:hypothetical protein